MFCNTVRSIQAFVVVKINKKNLDKLLHLYVSRVRGKERWKEGERGVKEHQ